MNFGVSCNYFSPSDTWYVKGISLASAVPPVTSPSGPSGLIQCWEKG